MLKERDCQRLVQERVRAAEHTRIRNALDNVSSCVLMADTERNIVHLDNTLQERFDNAEADMRNELPDFDTGKPRGASIDGFHQRSAEVAVEKDIDGVDDKQGFFRELGYGIDRLIGVVESAFNDIADVMDSVAHGDLTRPVSRAYQGTYGQVEQSINSTIARLEEINLELCGSSDVIANAAGGISSGNANLCQRAEQNAASLEAAAASMQQLTSTVRNNADNAQQANQIPTAARQLAQQGGAVVGRAVEATAEIDTSSHRIAEILGVIDEIAFQTNLLALNASVEAARAGDQGRGFAVVANEVRNLVSRSTQAAKAIEELIIDSSQKVQSGSRLVNESGDTLEEVIGGVKRVADIIAEITAASAEPSAGIDQINQAVTSMDEAAQPAGWLSMSAGQAQQPRFDADGEWEEC